MDSDVSVHAFTGPQSTYGTRACPWAPSCTPAHRHTGTHQTGTGTARTYAPVSHVASVVSHSAPAPCSTALAPDPLAAAAAVPPGASRFTTALQLTATEQPEEQPAPPASAHPDHAGCASPGSAPDGGAASAACSLTLVYSVRCGASSVPWPMSATIENIMAEKALVGGGRGGAAEGCGGTGVRRLVAGV